MLSKVWSILTWPFTSTPQTPREVQTFFINQIRFATEGVSTFSRAPAPYASAAGAFQLSQDGTSVLLMKAGILTLNVTSQCRADTGTTILKPLIGLNGEMVPNSQSRLIWPAFVTGYWNQWSFAFALSVKAGDYIQLGIQLEQTTSDHIGTIIVGGTSSFLTLTLSQQ